MSVLGGVWCKCDPRLVAFAFRNLNVDMFVHGDGAAKRQRERRLRALQRHVRWTVAMEMATVRHHSYHKTTATGQPDSHRPKAAVFDQGIHVCVPRHHEFDVDSSPWWLLTMMLVLNQHMWTTVRKHLLGVVGSVPFGSISSMMRVPQVTESVFTEHVTTCTCRYLHRALSCDRIHDTICRYLHRASPVIECTAPAGMIQHVAPSLTCN